VIALDGYPCEPFPLDEGGLELATAQRMDVLVDAGPDVFKLQEVSTNQTLTAASFVPDATTRFSFPRPALQLPSVPTTEVGVAAGSANSHSYAGGSDGQFT
jgi:FtsP/CotA-like multicopper oxidase with cupredoxin domain